jgi:hypothetical protein
MTITLTREEAQQVLDALEHSNAREPIWKTPIREARETLRARLSAPEPSVEPYGQVTVVKRPGCVEQHWFYRWPEPPYLDNAAECHTVYTAPPQREWQGLTDEEITALKRNGERYISSQDFARAIEAKLKEKNA